MSGYVVVVQEDADGVMDFPTLPGAVGLMRQLHRTASAMSGGQPVSSGVKYMQLVSGGVLGFTAELSEAEVFGTRQQAQQAIDRIPQMIRPGGLSVQPLEEVQRGRA